MSAPTRAYLMLLAVAAIWGFAPPIIKVAFSSFPPLFFLTYRFLITNFILIPVLLLTEPDTWHTLSRLKPRDWFIFIGTGILGSTVQLGLLFWGLNYTTSLDAAVIGAIPPVLVAIGSVIFLKEKISRRGIIGLTVAFLGSIFIVIQPLFEGRSVVSGSLTGNFLVFLGTVSWAVYVIITKLELRHRLSPLLLTANMFFTGFISISFISVFYYSPSVVFRLLSAAPISAHASVVYMAFISGALAYWLYQKAQKVIAASRADIFLYLSPVFTAPLAYYFLDEPITLPLIIGSFIIAAGVIISQTRR